MPYIYGGAGKGERELCIGEGTVYVCMYGCLFFVCVCMCHCIGNKLDLYTWM